MRDIRIVVHDFVGHAFPIELSREFAARGHDVLHLYFADFEAPKGPLHPSRHDPVNLRVQSATIDRPYEKYAPVRRAWDDLRYVGICSRVMRDFKPDVVLSGCGAPFAQNQLRRACQQSGISFVAWVQDLYGPGVRAVLHRKLGSLGALVGSAFTRMDESLVRNSDGVVFISEEFQRVFAPLRPRARGPWHVIENWAPIHDLPCRPKINDWSRSRGLAEKRVLLYSGTLGLKHNPELLARLAQSFRKYEDVAVVVISQGLGRDYLERSKAKLGLTNLPLLDYQPFEAFPEVMASGDVLLALIEREASSYSAPSKVLSYLCASRPLLLSIPASNPSSRIVISNNAGLVVEPDDAEGFINAAHHLLIDREHASRLASNARAYAVSAFDIGKITDRFEAALLDSLRPGHPAPAPAEQPSAAGSEEPAAAMAAAAGPRPK